MTLSLDKILQDALEYEKIRDAATPGEWISILQEDNKSWHEIYSTEFPGLDIAKIVPWMGHVEANATFIAAAKNYDCVSVIKSLVERVKDLENSIIHDVEIGYEYQVTDGPRKCWDGEPDLSKEGWEEYKEWERFQYHEERYWRRKKEPKVKP